jgi:hypothetical protein
MKSHLFNAKLLAAIFFLGSITISCNEKAGTSKQDDVDGIFPKGEAGPTENFTGKPGTLALFRMIVSTTPVGVIISNHWLNHY